MTVSKVSRVLLTCMAAGLVSAATGDEPAATFAPSTADQARLQLAAPLTANSSPTGDSRYRRINGQWWYLLNNNRWALWDGAKWTVPSTQASPYYEWRRRQIADRYTGAAAEDDAMRRREVDRWRAQAAPGAALNSALTQSDASYHKQMDRFHDTLMTTPYDYRLGTAGHGLFECDPDRVIAQSGRFNYATSAGGFMGGALRSPFGY